MLEKVKLALRITTDAFDSEIQDLIDATACTGAWSYPTSPA